MLDFDYLARINSRVPWLFISTRERSAGFLLVIALALIFVVRLETLSYWYLFANEDPQPERGSFQLLLQTIASTLPDDHKDLVVILGGSTAQELTADDPLVSKDLSKRCHRDIRFANLGYVLQTFDESWDIASLMPVGRTRLILVVINPLRLSIDDVDIIANLQPGNGIPVSYSLLWLVFRKTGYLGSLERAATSIISQVKQGAAWKPQDLLWPRPSITRPDSPDPFNPLRSMFGEQPVFSVPARQMSANQYLSDLVLGFRTKVKGGVAWWNRFRDHFNRQDTAVRFVVLPTDQTFSAAEQLTETDFESALRGLGAGRVLDLRRPTVELSTDDFFDGFHLSASGREKLHPNLVEKISEILGCRPDRPK